MSHPLYNKYVGYLYLQILGALGTENNRPSSAAQCVAYVAVAELPVGQWSELIPLLVNNVVNPSSTEMMKEATLETIGYICQEIESEVLVSQSNEILTAIIHGMKGSSTSNHVRLAATSALYNSLEFTKGNFEKEVSIGHIILYYNYYIICDNYCFDILIIFTDRTKLYNGSCVRGHSVYQYSDQSGCVTMSCENYVIVLSIHGTIYGSCTVSCKFLFD